MSQVKPDKSQHCECKGCCQPGNEHLEGEHLKDTPCFDLQEIGIKLAGDVLQGVCIECAIEILKKLL